MGWAANRESPKARSVSHGSQGRGAALGRAEAQGSGGEARLDYADRAESNRGVDRSAPGRAATGELVPERSGGPRARQHGRDGAGAAGALSRLGSLVYPGLGRLGPGTHGQPTR